MVIDIMESCELTLPHGGSICKHIQVINSVLVGALVHGIGLTLYRTTNTIHKSANLIIHVFLRELEKWIARNGGNRPEMIYLQVDGGSENANKYVLAMLELLVVKRVTSTIGISFNQCFYIVLYIFL